MIYIPTLGRTNRQETAQALHVAGIPFLLVCREAESEPLRSRGFPVLVEPNDLPRGIGHTRQFIMDYHEHNRVIMMDDDLSFARRGKRTDNPLYLSPCTPEDIREMINLIEDHLDNGYAMVGISSREGNNRKEGEWSENTRIMRVFGIHKPSFVAAGCDFTAMKVMEDFDVTLTLLTHGYKNIEINTFTNNQPGSNMDGGCKEYRTLETQKEAAFTLSAKYPGLVTPVEKETKGSWGGGVRTDVRIAWKKAYTSGLIKRSKESV